MHVVHEYLVLFVWWYSNKTGCDCLIVFFLGYLVMKQESALFRCYFPITHTIIMPVAGAVLGSVDKLSEQGKPGRA